MKKKEDNALAAIKKELEEAKKTKAALDQKVAALDQKITEEIKVKVGVIDEELASAKGELANPSTNFVASIKIKAAQEMKKNLERKDVTSLPANTSSFTHTFMPTLEKLGKDTADLSKLKTEQRTLDKSISLLQETVETQTIKVKAIVDALNKAIIVATAKEALGKDIDEGTKVIDAANKAMGLAKDAVQLQQAEVDRLKAQFNELQQALIVKQDKIAQIQTALSETQTQLQAADDALIASNEALNRLQTELVSIDPKELAKQIMQLEKYAQNKEEVDRMNQAIDAVTGAMTALKAKARDNSAKKEADLADLNSQLSALKQKQTSGKISEQEVLEINYKIDLLVNKDANEKLTKKLEEAITRLPNDMQVGKSEGNNTNSILEKIKDKNKTVDAAAVLATVNDKIGTDDLAKVVQANFEAILGLYKDLGLTEDEIKSLNAFIAAVPEGVFKRAFDQIIDAETSKELGKERVTVSSEDRMKALANSENLYPILNLSRSYANDELQTVKNNIEEADKIAEPLADLRAKSEDLTKKEEEQQQLVEAIKALSLKIQARNQPEAEASLASIGGLGLTPDQQEALTKFAKAYNADFTKANKGKREDSSTAGQLVAIFKNLIGEQNKKIESLNADVKAVDNALSTPRKESAEPAPTITNEMISNTLAALKVKQQDVEKLRQKIEGLNANIITQTAERDALSVKVTGISAAKTALENHQQTLAADVEKKKIEGEKANAELFKAQRELTVATETAARSDIRHTGNAAVQGVFNKMSEELLKASHENDQKILAATEEIARLTVAIEEAAAHVALLQASSTSLTKIEKTHGTEATKHEKDITAKGTAISQTAAAMAAAETEHQALTQTLLAGQAQQSRLAEEIGQRQNEKQSTENNQATEHAALTKQKEDMQKRLEAQQNETRNKDQAWQNKHQKKLESMKTGAKTPEERLLVSNCINS